MPDLDSKYAKALDAGVRMWEMERGGTLTSFTRTPRDGHRQVVLFSDAQVDALREAVEKAERLDALELANQAPEFALLATALGIIGKRIIDARRASPEDAQLIEIMREAMSLCEIYP